MGICSKFETNVLWFICLCCYLFRQLDGAARSVFMENVRLNEALKCHIKRADDLQKLTDLLAKQKASLELDKVCLSCGTV